MGPANIRSVIGGSIGNLVEWYDWYVYSAFSLYFAPSFFPKGDQTAQLLNAAAVFAIGFLMRPVGGWLLGVYADKHGRKAGLTLSVWLMCAGSLAVALAPSYARIGVFAPVLLVAARLLQGLSVGGEYGASATYLSELAGTRHRGFVASFQYVTLIAGQLLALAVLLILQRALSEAQLADWGWRVPFAIGALASLAALQLRRRLVETAAFAGIDRARQHGLLTRLWAHRRAVALVIGLGAGGSLAFYTFTTYMQKFLVNTLHWSKPDASLTSAGTLVIYMLIQPAFGALSDHIGRRPQLIAFGVLGLLGTVPLLTLLSRTASHTTAFVLNPGRADHLERLHRDQRRREGRAVPGTYPRARGRAALCAVGVAVRRHRRVCRIVVQGCGTRGGVLLVCRGDVRRLAARGAAAAAAGGAYPHLIPLPHWRFTDTSVYDGLP